MTALLRANFPVLFTYFDITANTAEKQKPKPKDSTFNLDCIPLYIKSFNRVPGPLDRPWILLNPVRVNEFRFAITLCNDPTPSTRVVSHKTKSKIERSVSSITITTGSLLCYWILYATCDGTFDIWLYYRSSLNSFSSRHFR